MLKIFFTRFINCMLINISNGTIKQNSFKAMKPNQFTGLDYAAVRKFKAPVEKFNSHSDLQNWANLKLKELMDLKFRNKSLQVDIGRRIFINQWKDFLAYQTWTDVKKLVAFAAITKDLKENNDIIPPIVDENFINKTFSKLESELEQDKDFRFDFNKRYKNEIKTNLLKDVASDFSGWVTLPSQKHNKKDFILNVEKLKLLSNPSWCIKKWAHAESYLQSGDFHIYLEKGCPKLCIKFSGNEIIEIQGEKNNSTIPKEYLDILKKHIAEGQYFLNDDSEYLLEHT